MDGACGVHGERALAHVEEVKRLDTDTFQMRLAAVEHCVRTFQRQRSCLATFSHAVTLVSLMMRCGGTGKSGAIVPSPAGRESIGVTVPSKNQQHVEARCPPAAVSTSKIAHKRHPVEALTANSMNGVLGQTVRAHVKALLIVSEQSLPMVTREALIVKGL